MSTPGPGSPRESGPVHFRKRRVLVVTALVTVALLVAVGVTYWIQIRVTFPSPPASAGLPRAAAAAGGEVLWIETGDARVEAWLLPGAAQGPAPLLVYTHGNGELIDFWADEFGPVRAAGIHVLLVEYPGYGRSSGRPSERSITAALLAAYDRLARDARVDATRIVGHGRSLGGGAIAQLAARRPMAALVLESTFTSLADIVGEFGIPRWLMANTFDTRGALAQYDGPVLLMHGARDINIPVAHAQGLARAIPQASLRLLECGHNDCPRQWDVVLGFLAGNGVCRRTQEAGHDHASC